MTGSPDQLEMEADRAAAARAFGAAAQLLEQVVDADPARFMAWVKLGAMRRAGGDVAAALDAIDRALSIAPLDFSALLSRASLLDALGRGHEADLAFGRALAQAPDQPPPSLRPILDMARARFGGWQDRTATRLLTAARDAHALTDRVRDFVDAVVHRKPAERDGPTHYCYPGLRDDAFYPRGDFPWIEGLEAATDAIEAEFERVVTASSAELAAYIQYPASAPVEQWRALNHNRDWTAIHLINRGRRVDANAALCPATVAAIADLPQPVIAGAGPNAMFSLLAPHTHIPPHTGITNTRLVVHLPLIVPEGCWFRVGGDRRAWERGRAWAFDDTLDHEAMNPTDRLRVILIADVWHPDLTAEDRAGIAAVIGAGDDVHGL